MDSVLRAGGARPGLYVFDKFSGKVLTVRRLGKSGFGEALDYPVLKRRQFGIDSTLDLVLRLRRRACTDIFHLR
jgi:hypothetical protein